MPYLGQAHFMTKEIITRIFIDRILWLLNYCSQDILPPVPSAKYQFIYKVHKHSLWSEQQLGWQVRSKFPWCKVLYPWNPQYQSTAIYNTLLQPSFGIPYIIFSVSYHSRSPPPQDDNSPGKLQTGKITRIIKNMKWVKEPARPVIQVI